MCSGVASGRTQQVRGFKPVRAIRAELKGAACDQRVIDVSIMSPRQGLNADEWQLRE